MTSKDYETERRKLFVYRYASMCIPLKVIFVARHSVIWELEVSNILFILRFFYSIVFLVALHIAHFSLQYARAKTEIT